MIALIKNTASTIAVGQIEEKDQYQKIITMGLPVLKDLVKMIAAYDAEAYVVGVIQGDNGVALVLLPEGNVNVGFIAAGLYEPGPDKAQTKIVEEATS